MADEKVKITDLATADTPTGAEYIPVSQNGVTRKLALSNLPRQSAILPEVQTYSGNTAYEIPAGYLLQFIVILPQSAAITVKIGRTSGGNDLLYDQPIASGKSATCPIGIYSPEGAAETIYISGITSSTKIIFYKV